MIKNKDFIEYS